MKLSQNPEFPVSNLIFNQGYWESKKFPQYPQQLTLMFYQPVIINQIKIITHIFKVPQRINILYHLPTNENPNEFQKLGYIKFKSPKSSSGSDGSSEKRQTLRQVKVINNLSLNAQYLRLILSKNHSDKNNFFNQVSLFSIGIEGSQLSNLSSVILKNDSFVQINYFVKDKISLLNQFKENCIAHQQFNEANQIKFIIEQVMLLLQEMKHLNEQKIQCIHMQDYTAANEIKQDIKKIKDKIQEISNNFYDPSSKKIKTFSIQKFQKSKFGKLAFQNQFMKHENENGLYESKITEYENEQPSDGQISHQKKIVPALLNKINPEKAKQQENQQQEDAQGQILPEEPQQISPSNEANSSILVQFFDKVLIRKLHSKYWQFKNQAIQQVLNDSKKYSRTKVGKNRFRAYLFAYNKILSRQNHKHLLIITFSLFQSISEMQIQENDYKSQLTHEMQKAVLETLNKKDSQNSKVQAQAQATILRMLQSSIFGSNFLLSTLTKCYNEKLSPKIKKIFLQTVEQAVNRNNNASNSLIEFTVKRLNDPNNDVRKSAMNILKKIKGMGLKDKIVTTMNEQSIKQLYFKELEMQ